jgi:hypothetical protein
LLTGIRQKSARQWSGVGRVVVSIVGVISLVVDVEEDREGRWWGKLWALVDQPDRSGKYD